MSVAMAGYVARKTVGRRGGAIGDSLKNYRNWWLVKYLGNNSNIGVMHVGVVQLPHQYIGKRVRLKIEVVE